MKTITIRLDDDFHKDLKRYALEHDITIQDLTVEALKDKIENYLLTLDFYRETKATSDNE